LALAACGGGDKEAKPAPPVAAPAAGAPAAAPAPAPAAPAPRERLSLKYGLLVTVSTEWTPFVAQDKGYYDREGLDVEFVYFNNFGDVNTALTSGRVDVVLGALVSPILAKAQGVPMKLIMAGHNTREGYNNWYATLPNSKYKSPKDLEGATINVVAEGTFAWTIANTILHKNGLLGKVKLVALPFPESYAALKTGRADVAIFIEPFFSLGNKLSQQEFGAPMRVLWTFEDAFEMDDIVLSSPALAMEDTIQKKPEHLRRFVKATLEAGQWGWKEENRNEVKQIIGKWTKTPPEILQVAMLAPATLNGRFPTDPVTGVGQLQRAQELLKLAGLLKTDRFFTDDELFDKRFLP
jgi:ABC-type nitrate/sulfonate/bicarbonate transport system substrate-binding protein